MQFRSAPSVALPDGLQFALTWGIPDDFGGMTSAMLHRSRAFVRLSGRPVDILTFDARTDYDRVEARLRASAELIDGMRLINLWDWLRTTTLPDSAPGMLTLDRHPYSPLDSDPGELVATRLADDGTVLQVDYRRADGTVVVSDRRDVAERGVIGGRSVVLCDERGVPVRSWGRIWALYRMWLDLLRERRPSFFIVDSKTVARFAATYVRKRAVMMHLVHGSHLQGGELSAARRETFENLDSFDSVVLLTHRQRSDVESLLGPRNNLAVIPNGREPTPHVRRARDVHHGVVLSSLIPRKRVAHSITAVRSTTATLDIYGDGIERPTLEAVASGRVHFHGYSADARRALATASFLLSTSTAEGLPLSLVEAMSAGCLPIAYDVAYGPSDLIVDGRTGFLVPPGDTQALAAAIERLIALPRWRVARMRRAAVRASSAFSDLTVTRLWAHEMRAAAARKADAWAQRVAPTLASPPDVAVDLVAQSGG